MRRARLIRLMLLVAGTVSVVGLLVAGSASAAPCGCWDQVDNFTPSFTRAGERVDFSFHYAPGGCACVADVCGFLPDDLPIYPVYETSYNYEFWWDYGGADQMLLGSGSWVGTSALDVQGSFTVPATAGPGNHSVTFVIDRSVTRFCSGVAGDTTELNPVLLAYTLTVRNPVGPLSKAPPGAVINDVSDAKVRGPGAEETQTGSQPEPDAVQTDMARLQTGVTQAQVLPNTGSQLHAAPLLLLAGIGLLIFSLRRENDIG